MAAVSPSHVVFDAAAFDAAAGLLVAPVIFFSLPILVCINLQAPAGPVAALVVATLALLPRLLWRTSQPAEGWSFNAANLVYWNLVYPVFFGSPFFVIMCCCLQPRIFLPLAALYVLFIKVLSRPDLKGGAGWQYFSQHDWGIVALRRFLRLRLHVSRGLRAREPSKPIVIAIHPHGVASDYRVAMDGLLYQALPGRKIYTLGASVLFSLPLVRELCIWTRCIDASKKIAAGALRKGMSLQVIPGGEAEQMRTQTGVEEVYLARRAGFVKLAMQHGAALVPCYAFGTTDLYDITPAQHTTNSRGWLWTLSKKYGVAMPRYQGSFGFMPKRLPNDLVFGEPFEPPCATPCEPTDAEVSTAHAMYITQLKALFDEHKAALGYADRELVVS